MNLGSLDLDQLPPAALSGKWIPILTSSSVGAQSTTANRDVHRPGQVAQAQTETHHWHVS